MKLDNFKELLLKKSEDNDNLQLLIKYMKDDYLVDHVVESLEKMAASSAARNPNAAVIDFAKNMNKQKAGMLHDALSHHASHYKAALKSGDTETADKHMGQIFKTMHMVNKFTKNGVNQYSPTPFEISAVDPKPWERAGYQNTKNRSGEDTGKFTTDTNGWARHGSSTNYDWLRGAPHADSKKTGDSHYKKEVSKHGHNKAYPLEEMKVNGKHLHIEDVEHAPGEFASHPMDSHPIYNHYKTKPSEHGSDKHAKYVEEHSNFHNHPEGGKAQFRAKMANITKEDFAKRGAEKSSPVHSEIEGLDISDKVKSTPSEAAPSPTAGKSKKSDFRARLEAIKKLGIKND